MPQIVGKASQKSTESRAVLQSVTITASAGGVGSVSIYYGKDTSAESVVKLSVPVSTSGQFFFNNVLFEDGMTVTPNEYVESYMVEYG